MNLGDCKPEQGTATAPVLELNIKHSVDDKRGVFYCEKKDALPYMA